MKPLGLQVQLVLFFKYVSLKIEVSDIFAVGI